MMSTFRPDCTLPTSAVNYVYPANSRGTLNIIWSCLSILILCLWNVIHINVRAPLLPSVSWSRVWFYSTVSTLLVKLQWMAIAFFGPEILIAKALHDRIIVSESVKMMQKYAEVDGVRWTATHAHFANMGAFVVTFPVQPPLEARVGVIELDSVKGVDNSAVDNAESGNEQTNATVGDEEQNSEKAVGEPGNPTTQITIEQIVEDSSADSGRKVSGGRPSPSAETAAVADSVKPALSNHLEDSFGRRLKTISPRYGQELWQKDNINHSNAFAALQTLKDAGVASIRLRARQRNVLALQGTTWILDAAQIQIARSFGEGGDPFLTLPDIHEQQLESESKSDPLLKLVTIVQVLWMAIELIARLYRHIPASQLEIMTFSYAVCSIITYIALLEKPKDVSLTKTIPALRYPTDTELLDIALAGPSAIFGYRSGYWIPNNAVHHIGFSPTMTSQHLSIQEKIKRLDSVASYSRVLFIATGCVGAIVFGSLHFISWDFQFPTPVERTAWRVAICITVGLPLVGALSQALFAQLFQRSRRRHGTRAGTETYQRFYLRLTAWLVIVVGGLYLIARLFLLVEVFRSLAYLPAEAYRTTWAASVPHIG